MFADHFPHLQHSIEILDSSGLTFPARVIAAGDGTRLEAKSRRATTEGPSSGENVKGGRRDKKASGYTGQVIIVQRAAAAGSEEHSAGGAPSSDGQPVHPGGHESHEGVRRGRQGNVSQGQRRTARPASHPCVERSTGRRNAKLGRSTEGQSGSYASASEFADGSQGVREANTRSWGGRLFTPRSSTLESRRTSRRRLKRLEINIVDKSPSDEAWQIIREDLKRDKEVRELPGVAPAGDLERQLQRFLDEVNGTTGSR